MTALQKIVLGTPPAAVDGDPVRTASSKLNANVDVLNAQSILSSFPATLTTPQTLTAANHLGKRVNINLAAAGTINLPPASSCVADGVILLRNLGTTIVTLAIAAGSGDGLNVVGSLYSGDTMLLDTDGVHTWGCILRGRSSTNTETVPGNCSVLGNETVGGTLAVGGAITSGGSALLTGAGNLSGLASPATARTNLGVGRTLLQTISLAAGGPNFVFAIPGGYTDYELEFDSLNVSTNAANLILQVAPDTANWIAGTNYSGVYEYLQAGSTTVGVGGLTNNNTLLLFTGLSNTAPYSTWGTLKLRGAGANGRVKNFMWEMSSMTSSGAFFSVRGGGISLSSGAVGGLLLFPSAGTFLSGSASLYGVNS